MCPKEKTVSSIHETNVRDLWEHVMGKHKEWMTSNYPEWIGGGCASWRRWSLMDAVRWKWEKERKRGGGCWE